MKLKFLGTSAGEQYPGIWCECANCSKARDLGGKNIRRNSCLCIDDEILLDLPYEIASQAREFNVKLTAINSLLLTHSHKDHFHPYILLWRQRDERASLDVQKYGLEFSVLPEMNVFGNAEVCRLIKEELGGDLDKYFLILYEARPFEEFKIGNKKVMPVPANHSTGKDECPLNYIVSDGDATFFYGLDSGWFLPESYEVIKKYKYDAVVVEGTFGVRRVDKQHFDFEKASRAARLFLDDGLLKKGALFIVSHFSPHCSPEHEKIESYFLKENIIPAFDGMEALLGE